MGSLISIPECDPCITQHFFELDDVIVGEQLNHETVLYHTVSLRWVFVLIKSHRYCVTGLAMAYTAVAIHRGKGMSGCQMRNLDHS